MLTYACVALQLILFWISYMTLLEFVQGTAMMQFKHDITYTHESDILSMQSAELQ